MKGFDLLIELEEATVLSERTATEGGHRGLDYIPGGALLGVAAARLYRTLGAEAFALFHSGRLRFGNALPLAADDTPAYPVPHAWHHAKEAAPEAGDRLIAERLWNLSHAPFPEGAQPKQLRAGYVTEEGRQVNPRRGLRMKTAIDPDTARAREGALFGYDALAAGTRLLARITADETIDDGLLDAVRGALGGEMLIGRSRSAEFGRARGETFDLTPIAHGEPEGQRLTLWLLSDLAPLDPHGLPTLTPRAEWLGLPKGELLLERSALRSRRYSPWNAYRQGPDLERQVLCQGGVMVFELEEALTDAARERIAAGLGAHREAGLGQVWLEPPLLSGEHPRFETPTRRAWARGRDAAVTAERPASDLIDWLQRQRARAAGRGEFQHEARRLAAAYGQVLADARRLKGYGPEVPVGPSASQWGGVAAAARGRDRGALVTALFHDRDGLCKSSAPGWRDEYFDRQHKGIRSIAEWLKGTLGSEPDQRLARHLCREIQDLLKQEARR